MDNRLKELKRILESIDNDISFVVSNREESGVSLGNGRVEFNWALFRKYNPIQLINKHLKRASLDLIEETTENKIFFNTLFEDMVNFVVSNREEFPRRKCPIILNSVTNCLETDIRATITRSFEFKMRTSLELTINLEGYLTQKLENE